MHFSMPIFWTCLILSSFRFLGLIHPNCAANVNITVAVLTEQPDTEVFPFTFNRTSGLIDLAINKSRVMLSDVATLDFIVVPVHVKHCTALKWGAVFAEVYHRHRPHVLIGPGCSPSVRAVSRMAVSWNIPHITHVGTDESLSDKAEFSMLTRLCYTLNVFAKFYVYVFDAFKWTYVANIYDDVVYLPKLVGTNMQKSFEERAPHINSHPIPFDPTSKNLEGELIRVLKEAASRSRVFMVCCHGDVFRQMVLLARRLDFLEEGKYQFLFYFQVYGDPPIGKYDWFRGDQLDKEAREAYESVMVIRPRRPITQEFFEFEDEYKRRATVNFNYKWEADKGANIYDIGFYDAFMLYAHVLNETVAANEDPRNGSNIMARIWNRTFPGIGGEVFVNSNGDRDTDFTLLDLNPITGKFQVVAEYLGWKGTFEFIKNVSIHWPNNAGPPPNVPVCGFTGEKCRSYSLPTYVIVTIVLSVIIVLVLIAGILAYRRVKTEASLYSEWWRVKSDEISMQTESSFFSQRSQVRAQDDDQSLATHAACFQTVGVYKGSQVHIRKPNIKSLAIERTLLLELKQMHEITCQNLTRLIGVCPETDNVSILTEYCSRGNLQDILQNESIQLDRAFKISLVNDIVEGMTYLHSSPIGVHGRLTSTRCVIDSRFVLKITGFGLKTLNEVKVKKNRPSEAYSLLPELLWMAPEHLRLYPPRRCTQAGDVYSFGIILYEMLTRNEPYVQEVWYRGLDDTLARIKKGGPHPTRPGLEENEENEDLVRLATCCWHENPFDRPTFVNIRRQLKKFGLKTGTAEAQNVLDVLLKRMEQYANNLEGLVEERTHQFLEEKRKSDALLYQVLPKSVAEELRAGRSVPPEAYDSVTIYFSDIVGFTNIAAKSSPFQIVDLLNDLYTCFDSIIDHYDVYKVETIGDAYMVVSGLPERNGTDHVRQVARMSLKVLDSVRKFTIRHQPHTPLKARIGLHSGSVCAGVVGRKMPRYCLFGDTVNTASRMESTGQAMSIHISQDTKVLLDGFENFVIEERGTLDIKGKGTMTTYWLIDEIQRNMTPSFVLYKTLEPEVSC